jgi:hypothetical protein
MKPDIFPNKFKFKIEQASANAYTELTIPTGLASAYALERGKNKKLAINILGILLKIPQYDVDGDRVLVHLKTFSDTAHAGIDERGVIFDFDEMYTLATNGILVQNRLKYFDIGAQGLGEIAVTDNLYVGFDTIDYAAAQTLYGEIYYRYVEITTDDYNDMFRDQISYS